MPKPKKNKPLSGKKLTKTLDQIIRDIFKFLYGDNPQCFVCKSYGGWYHPKERKGGVQVGHYIARKCTILRWDLLNLYPQCAHCNIVHNTNPAPFTLAIIKEFDVDRVNTLNTMYKEHNKIRHPDSERRTWLLDLQTKLKELQNNKN